MYSTSVYAQPANDNFANAVDITSLIGGCSADAAYTTINGTSDQNAGSCWNNSGPRYNVWFKFTATASGEINVTIDRGGSKGTQSYTQLALWESDGTTEIKCKRYATTTEDVVVGATGLSNGSTYYISVDTYNSNTDGTFTICINDAVDYDYYEGAVDVTSLIGSCSADAAYTTIGGSSDKNAGSCWNNSGPRYNRWFKFTAPSNGVINITCDRGGSKGTQSYTQMALWQSDGTTEVTCKRYATTTEDVVLGNVGLTPGSTYYISVDTYNSNTDGTFTLCLDSLVDYDYYEGAVDITSLIGTCSADAAYTTIGGSGDKNAGSCWNNSGPRYNRWFKFTAPSNGVINITCDRGGSKGTQSYTQMALWQNDGTTEVSCKRYATTTEDVILGNVGLTPGSTYYLSIDTYNSNTDGTFTLCLDSLVDYDYYEGAVDITSLIGTCSADAAYTTIGGSGDKNAGSCWNNSGPRYNRWFKFTAPSNGVINITCDRGGSKGTQSYTQMALWQSNGTTEVACKRYATTTEDVILGNVGLTPGSTYYLSIDTYNSNTDGTFTLCLDSLADYDYYEGAVDITSLIGGCSSDAAYTTIGGSGDKNAGSCWNNSGPRYNRWFKFTAPASGQINITCDRGGSKGTQSYTQMALWQGNGTTEVTCKRYATTTEDVVIASTSLTPGSTYYLSVDTYNSNTDGTFTLCLDDTPDYDYFEGAIDVTGIINGCSSDAEYTTIGGSGDKNAGSCWNNSGPRYNRWFKFTAPASGYIQVTCDRGGSKGTQSYTQMAIWQSDGTTEVECKRYATTTEDVIIDAIGLTPGSTYYISVDTYNSNTDGTFTLCLDDDPSYDFYEGAIELTDLNNWCSSDAEYTTIGGSGDKNAGSCWNNSGPRYNRWFKFTAVSTNVTITVDRGGSKGTQSYTQLALWQSDGTTEVACQRYASTTDDVSISNGSLTIGNTYYISVDTYNANTDGTFTLCVDNVDTEFYSITSGAWNANSTWSIVSHVGAAASDYPKAGDIVYIQGDQITVTGTETSAEVNLTVADANTELLVNGGTLNVQGQVNLTNTGNNFDGEINVTGSGTLNINDDLTMTRSGGANTFSTTIATGSTIDINRDLNINSSAGTSNNNLVTIDGTGSLIVDDNINLVQSASGIKSQITANSTASITVGENVVFTAVADDKVEIELNSTASLTVKGDFTMGSPAYGILDFNGTNVLTLDGVGQQDLPSFAGSGTGDVMDVSNITVNNTYGDAPQVRMVSDISIDGTLTLTDGVVGGQDTYTLTIENGASISGNSAAAYIDAPVKKIGSGAMTFPIGDGDIWAPLDIANLTGDAATEFTAEYKYEEHSDRNDVTGGLYNVSSEEYWNLTNSGTSSNADVTLHWKNASRSGINDYDELVLAHYNGSGQWESLGQSSAVKTDPGSITVTGVSSFSPFSFGSTSNSLNPLPVELVSFAATKRNQEKAVHLLWITASEINNDFFTVERSKDLEFFEEVDQVLGAGTTNQQTIYESDDYFPFKGLSYYRLSQTDFDGTTVILSLADIDIDHSDDLEDVLLYPNPIKPGEQFFLQLPEEIDENCTFLVNDLLGRSIISEVSNYKVVDQSIYGFETTTALPEGVYLISFEIEGVIISRKLVVD